MLAQYRVEAKLGEGGMGAVYRGFDTRLQRQVALKVLSPENFASPECKRRLMREARAASALNHPNIVTVHEIGSEGGLDFIAMELVEGKTLREVIPAKGLPLGKLLDYAVQIAAGLARIHACGEVHRDLKPGNIMLTSSGLVKLLDFGLARRINPDHETTLTAEGEIAGTPAYMSPEQAEGKTLDARSDIFSFGAVLYEMATGRRAFLGDSSASTLSTVLHREPKPPETIPLDLEKIIRRCLRKDADKRFQHIDDIKVALEEIREDSVSGGPEGAQAVPLAHPRRWRIQAAVASLVLIAAAGAFYETNRFLKRDAPLEVVPLASYPGFQCCPSFSPDGSQLAFAWNGEKQDNLDIYVKLVSGGPPLRLTTDPAPETAPAWSPNGAQIAFLRRGRIFLISPLGGPERSLTKTRGGLFAWSPDGKWLAFTDMETDTSPEAIYLVSIATGERRKLTSRQTGTFGGDYSPAFAPDGKSIAFVRSHVGALVNEIYVLPLANGIPNGEALRLTDDKRYVHALAWTPDSREIVFSSSRGGRRSLWRISSSGKAEPRLISGTEDGLNLAISSGKSPRLAYQRVVSNANIWQMEISPSGKPLSPPRRILAASSRLQRDPQFSPDGKSIAFTSDRSGNLEIWVSESDGSNPVQLTAFAGTRTAGAPRWSPDGRRIAFDSGSPDSFDIYVIDAEGGAPRKLIAGACVRPSWSRDGRWIYFGSAFPGANQIWKIPAEGGRAVQVTRSGGLEAFESRDGKTLYFSRA